MPILDYFLINGCLYREILPITNTECLCSDSQLDQVFLIFFLIFIFSSLFCWWENSHILALLRKMCGPLPFDPPSSSRNQRQFRPTSRFHTSLGKSHTLNSQLKPAENLEAWQCLPRNDPWLCHVNAWQKPLQYCKVISLKIIKINQKKKKNDPHSC